MMDKKWFQTVGVPGGEFAMQAESRDAAEDIMCKDLDNFGLCIRPCPPDLVEWLDCALDERQTVWTYRYTPPHAAEVLGHQTRLKTAGGWNYFDFYRDTPWFVPVAGAAGLTVLEESNAD